MLSGDDAHSSPKVKVRLNVIWGHTQAFQWLAIEQAPVFSDRNMLTLTELPSLKRVSFSGSQPLDVTSTQHVDLSKCGICVFAYCTNRLQKTRHV